VIELKKSVPYKKMNNFLEGLSDIQEDIKRNTVIEIQKMELKLVAFSFVATFFKTA